MYFVILAEAGIFGYFSNFIESMVFLKVMNISLKSHFFLLIIYFKDVFRRYEEIIFSIGIGLSTGVSSHLFKNQHGSCQHKVFEGASVILKSHV
jgi:hypothetical protein